MASKDPEIADDLLSGAHSLEHYPAEDALPIKGHPLDGGPTAEELATLRRVPGRLPWTAHTISFVEMCERFSFCGTVAVLQNYIQQPLPKGSVTGAGFKGISGALGLGQRAATSLTTCSIPHPIYLLLLLPFSGELLSRPF